MAIAYVANRVAGANGTAPQTSGAYTPGAGGALIAAISDRSGTGKTTTLTATVGSFTQLSSANGLNTTTNSLWDSLNAAASSRTNTFDSSPTGDFLILWVWEFSGVGSVNNVSQLNTSSSSTTSNSISGSAVTVPTGSILIAACLDTTRAIGNNAIADAGATSDYQSGFDMVLEHYAGAGASITPHFTPRAATATNYTVFQAILAPPVIVSAADYYYGMKVA